MVNTLGFHIVKSAYGLWLPGDDRGHWSSDWDEMIGYVEPHTLHAGDPVRRRMAAERMKHPPVRWTDAMIDVIARQVGRCADESDWDLVAASFEPTHMHLLMSYHTRDIDKTCKWMAQQAAKAVHAEADHTGPVFAKSNWCSFVFDPRIWTNTERYIDRHNERRGVPAKPYPWLSNIPK